VTGPGIGFTEKDLYGIGVVIALLDGLQQAGNWSIGGECGHCEQGYQRTKPFHITFDVFGGGNVQILNKNRSQAPERSLTPAEESTACDYWR
jgi:hypothetical protein